MLHKPTVCSVFVSLLYGQHSSMVERVKKLGCESCRVYVTIDGVECIEYIQRILRQLYFFRDIKKNTRVNIMEQNCIFITSGGFRGGAPPPSLFGQIKKNRRGKESRQGKRHKTGPSQLKVCIHHLLHNPVACRSRSVFRRNVATCKQYPDCF